VRPYDRSSGSRSGSRRAFVALGALFFFFVFFLSLRSEAAGRVVSSSTGAQFEIGRLVGKGGFGRVYKGWELAPDRTGAMTRRAPVAIKQYESLASAITEDAAMRGVKSMRNLPRVVGDGYDERTGSTFLVSRWVPGRTLDRWAAATKASVPEVVGVVTRASTIVGNMHAKGWVHLDLKPNNIMIDRRRNVTVIDVGIAQKKAANGKIAAAGEGTHEFMPPEQRAKGEVDERADVFALAGTLYRLLARENPIAATNQPATVATHLERIEDPALRAIVAKGLAQNPADRYANADSFAQALRRWQAASRPAKK
jgi:serine/threonine-protein kinase